MLWRKRFMRRWLYPVTGFLLMVVGLELTHHFITPALFTSWFEPALAEVATVRPNANGTGASTASGCGAGGRYDCLDDAVTSPTAPGTGTDYVEFSLGGIDFYQMQDIPSVSSVSSITVFLYHNTVGNQNVGFGINLYAANETTTYGTQQNLATAGTAQWSSVTFNGLSLTQAQMNDLRIRLECRRTAGAGPGNCRGYAMYAVVTYDPVIDVTVGATGTQQNLDVGTTTAYVGGAFRFVRNVGSGNITTITVTETGTIDAQNNLKNIRLFYDLDTSLPYDCASESYNGSETQFGSTVAGGFTAANGIATFTGTVNTTTTQTMCVYVVVDVQSGANPGETIELQITNPVTDVGFVGSFIAPTSTVALPGTTIVQKTNLTQTGYHWRNDDGSETTATSATGGSENTPFSAAPREQTIRLRMAVSNEGNKTSDPTQYRLEYATKVTTCSAATGWADPVSAGGNWDMSPTGNLTDGGNTTNIATSTGGVSNPNTTFLTPNGGVRDTTSQTGNLTLTSTQYVELEYAIEATAIAGDGITYCFRLTNAGTPLDTYDTYPEATTFSDLTVGSIGTQIATVDIASSSVYAGGAFTIVDQTAGAHSINNITITATGTANLATAVENIRLLYEFDTSAPYDCASVSYGGGEAQYGSTASTFNGFGQATFSGSISVNPTQAVCLYVVYDVTSNAVDGTTIDIQITDPSTQVVIDAGDIGPASLIALSGNTTFITDLTTQKHYHWRNNDGTETTATSATGGSPDTPLSNLRRNSPIRLRLAVSNEGGKTTPAYQYRLEWAQLVSTCSAATGWTDVNAVTDAWNMFSTANLTEGGNTTNIATSTGGVPDPQPTFLSTNGGVRDVTSQTGSITLAADNFVELEYSIVAGTAALEGGTYCFRVTNAGTPIMNYEVYPQVQIKFATDFLIQRGTLSVTGTTGTITAGTQYEAPSNASNAFIRITGTNHSGTGGGTTGNADDVTVYVSNPGNIATSITFTRPATAAGTTRVSWEIIEYIGAPGGQNEMIVRQHGTQTYVTGNLTQTTGTVSGVTNDNDVVVFVTGQLNPDTGTLFPRGLSTAAWNSGPDTATFTRGESGNAAILSYAVVEFTGSNWRIQRVENTYSATMGTIETQSISPVNSLSRAFLHAQKRMGAGRNTHGDYGHIVTLSGIGQVSFQLDSTGTTPASHTSVAWVIENIQTAGERMIVTPLSGSQSGGTAPVTANLTFGITLDDLDIASLFVTNTGDEPGGGSGQNSFPEPMIATRLISTTQYEVFVPDTDDSRSWEGVVVEWPTAARTFTQDYYRFYVNTNAITPTDPWPVGATNTPENTEIALANIPVKGGEPIRLRMSIQINAAAKQPGIDSFRLQYAERVTSCGAVTDWSNVGTSASSTALWRGYVNATPTSGTPVSGNPPTGGQLLLSTSDIAGTYEEQGTSALTPYQVNPGENVEFDWSIQHNGAEDKTVYCFRMVEANGTPLLAYNFYPQLLTAGYEPILQDWRWYEDDANANPATPVAGENVTPADVAFPNIYRLRLNLREIAGASGEDVKFALQYSEYADFIDGGTTLTATTTCIDNSLWCYAESAGLDNTVINAALLASSDACTGGVGEGCGTYNSGVATSGLSFTHPDFATTEFEFVLRHAGARANVVYYFRLYDLKNNLVVTASSSNPNVLTEGAQLVFDVAGVGAGVSTEGIVTTATSTPTSILFPGIDFGTTDYTAHRITVDTNATEGYQVLFYTDDDLRSSLGSIIEPINGTNLAPVAWATGCAAAISCFGYHVGDDVLQGGSTRFAPNDSYAAATTTPVEIMHSAVPTIDVYDIVYAIEVSEAQPAGDYEAGITYIAVPIF
jgi:hypothetical protein